MTLQSSGQISFNDLRVELAIPSQAPFSITDAATGVYVTINTASPSRPNASTPHAISEWYSYNHTAAAASCYLVNNISANPSNTISWTSIDGVPRTGTLAANTSTNLCSTTTPFENPAAGVSVSQICATCTESCTTITCKQQCASC